MSASTLEHPGPDAGDAAAARWAAYLHSGHATDDGRSAFAAWLSASRANRAAFERVEQIWRDVDYAVVQDPALDAEVARLADAGDASAKDRGHDPRRRLVATALAASLVLAVGAWLALRSGPVPEQRYATSIGEIATVTLPDGSDVTLAGDTLLVTRFTRDERASELVKGQAFFAVTRNPARPFAITAGGNEVRVLGTRFDVQKRSSGLRVAVAEGTVEVHDLPDANAHSSSASPALQLNAGETVTAARDGTLSPVQAFDVERSLAWRNGRLEYVNAPLRDVIDEVNRYRAEQIRIMSDQVGDIPVTISLTVENTDVLLAGLELSEPVTVTHVQNMALIRAREADSE